MKEKLFRIRSHNPYATYFISIAFHKLVIRLYNHHFEIYYMIKLSGLGFVRKIDYDLTLTAIKQVPL